MYRSVPQCTAVIDQFTSTVLVWRWSDCDACYLIGDDKLVPGVFQGFFTVRFDRTAPHRTAPHRTILNNKSAPNHTVRLRKKKVLATLRAALTGINRIASYDFQTAPRRTAPYENHKPKSAPNRTARWDSRILKSAPHRTVGCCKLNDRPSVRATYTVKRLGRS